MADEIMYNYGLIDEAIAKMQRVSQTITSTCEDMTADAKRLLAESDGSYAAAYEEKQALLNRMIEDMNLIMNIRARSLDKLTKEMYDMDVKLGSSI